MKTQTLTVLSGLILFALCIYEFVQAGSALETSLMAYSPIAAISLFFFTTGNSK